MNRRRCSGYQRANIAAELHTLREAFKLGLLGRSVRRLVNRILPSTECSSSLEHVCSPWVIALSGVAAHTEDPDVLKREGLVRIFDVDVEVGDACNAVPDNLAVLFIGAESGALLVDCGEDESHQSFLRNAADVHLEECDLNRARAVELDPAFRMLTPPLADASLGVLMVVIPAANAATVIAPGVKQAASTKTLGAGMLRTEVQGNEVSLNVMPGSQTLGIAENVVAEAPLSEMLLLGNHNRKPPSVRDQPVNHTGVSAS